ncbi:MAG: tRNA pseudouridine(55) synthase TruB, partial [Butyrivibrio sp.]
HDVVAKLRGILKQKKIGHTGTLDPDATGVLPVCLGSATKLCEYLTDKTKEYEAVMLLGTVTDTEDISGNVLSAVPADVSEIQVRNVMGNFIGEYNQIPPMYSAIKINGKKLYELARDGKVIERQPRKVYINRIDIISVDIPRIKFRVECGKGTYIRSLCRDIGERLGCGACMEKLIRSRSGNFTLETARSLVEIEALVQNGSFTDIIYPPDSVFYKYPEIILTGRNAMLVSNGNKFRTENTPAKESQSMVRVYCDFDGNKVFMGIYRHEEDGYYAPVKMFRNGE